MRQLTQNLKPDEDLIPKDIGPGLKELALAWRETNALLRQASPDRVFYAGLAEGAIFGFVAALLLALILKRRN